MAEPLPLLADELDAINRLPEKPVPAPVPPTPEPAKPAPKLEGIDPPTPEIIARARELKSAESTFTHQENGKVLAQSKEDEAKLNPDWAGRPKEDPIEASDKADYLAMLLGAPFFEKQYSLCGGNLVLVFRTRTARVENLCARQVKDDELLDGPFGPVSSREAADAKVSRYMTYQCCASLTEIRRWGALEERLPGAQTVPPAAPAGHGPLRESRLELERALPGPLWAMVRNTHMKFEILVGRLIAEAENPDFWKAGSDS